MALRIGILHRITLLFLCAATFAIHGNVLAKVTEAEEAVIQNTTAEILTDAFKLERGALPKFDGAQGLLPASADMDAPDLPGQAGDAASMLGSMFGSEGTDLTAVLRNIFAHHLDAVATLRQNILARLEPELRAEILEVNTAFEDFTSKVNVVNTLLELANRIMHGLDAIVGLNREESVHLAKSLKEQIEAVGNGLLDGDFSEAIGSLRGESPFNAAIFMRFKIGKTGEPQDKHGLEGKHTIESMRRLAIDLDRVHRLKATLPDLLPAEQQEEFFQALPIFGGMMQGIAEQSAYNVAYNFLEYLTPFGQKLKERIDALLARLVKLIPEDNVTKRKLCEQVEGLSPLPEEQAELVQVAAVAWTKEINAFKRVIDGFEAVRQRCKLSPNEDFHALFKLFANAMEIMDTFIGFFQDDTAAKLYSDQAVAEIGDARRAGRLLRRPDGLLVRPDGHPYLLKTRPFRERFLGQRLRLLATFDKRVLISEMLRHVMSTSLATWYFFNVRAMLSNETMFDALFGRQKVSTAFKGKADLSANALVLPMVLPILMGNPKCYLPASSPLWAAGKKLLLSLVYYHSFHSHIFGRNEQSLSQIMLDVNEAHTAWPKNNGLVKYYLNDFIKIAGCSVIDNLEGRMYQAIEPKVWEHTETFTLGVIRPGVLGSVFRAFLPMMLLTRSKVFTSVANFAENDLYTQDFRDRFSQYSPDQRKAIYAERTIFNYVFSSIGFSVGRKVGQKYSTQILDGLDWLTSSALKALAYTRIIDKEAPAQYEQFKEESLMLLRVAVMQIKCLVQGFFMHDSMVRRMALPFLIDNDFVKMDQADDETAVNRGIILGLMRQLANFRVLSFAEAAMFVKQFEAKPSAVGDLIDALVETLGRNIVGLGTGYALEAFSGYVADKVYDAKGPFLVACS